MAVAVVAHVCTESMQSRHAYLHLLHEYFIKLQIPVKKTIPVLLYFISYRIYSFFSKFLVFVFKFGKNIALPRLHEVCRLHLSSFKIFQTISLEDMYNSLCTTQSTC